MIFADDVKLYICIRTVMDEFSLQNALNKLLAWADRWQLAISIKKCNVLHVSSQRSKHKNYPAYFLGDVQITSKSSVKDLGIMVDEHLTFKAHINSVVKKASQRSHLIQKMFSFSRYPKPP